LFEEFTMQNLSGKFSTFDRAVAQRSRLGKRTKRRRQFGLELLESRTLLTYTFSYHPLLSSVTVTESSGGDSFAVKNNGSGLLEYSIDGGAFSTNWNPGNGNGNHLSASVLSSVFINLTSDNSQIIDGDTTSPSSAASNVLAYLGVTAATSNTSDSVVINDQTGTLASGTYNIDGQGGSITGPTGGLIFPAAPLRVAPGSVPFGGGITLNGSDAGNIFNVISTFAGEPIAITGGTGDNTANIESTSASAAVTVSLGTGTNIVNAGMGNTVSTLAGAVIVTDPSTLNVNDSSDTNHPTATLDNLSGNVSAPYEVIGLGNAPIEYGTGVTALNLYGGTNGSSGVEFDVNATQGATTTTLYGGPNQNSFFLSNAGLSTGLNNLAGPITVNGGAALDDLVTLDDSSANFNNNYVITKTTVTRNNFGGLTYGSIGTLTLKAENTLGTKGNNTININNTANSVTTNVYGQGGVDTINVKGTASIGVLNVIAGTTAGSTVNVVADNEPVNITVNANDFINIGSMGGAGTMTGILGAIAIQDPPPLYTLTFHDETDTTARTWTLDDSDGLNDTASVALSGGIATTTYVPSALNSPLTLNGGSGGNTFAVTSTTGYAATDLFAGTGNNTVDVDETGDNTLAIDGQGGTDTVTLGGVSLVGMQSLQGSISVANTSPGSTALFLDDSGDSLGQTARLANTGPSGSVTGLAPAQITYTSADISSMTVHGGSGGNTFTVNGTVSNAAFPGTVTNLYKGVGHLNTVDVKATNAGSVLNIFGNGPARSLDDITLGAGIMGVVNIDELHGGLTNLTLDLSTDGLSHNFVLSSDGTTTTLHDKEGNHPDVTFPTASLSMLTIDTDPTFAQTLNVDMGEGGNPIPTADTPGLVFNAGDPATQVSHALNIFGKVNGAPFASETDNAEDPLDGGPTHYGDISFTDSMGTTTSLAYSGLQPIVNTSPAVHYTFNDFGYPDQSFSATDGTPIGALNTIAFTSTPATPSTTNFETTTIANKQNVTFNTPSLVPGVAGAGLIGVVDIPTASTGLTRLTFTTATNASNTVTFVATPAGVATSLAAGTADDTTNVAGPGVATGTTLIANGGPGANTLNYDAGGETPTFTPGTLPGEVLITIPGAGTVDAINYDQINIVDLGPAVITPGPALTINTVEGFQLVDAVVGTFSLTLPTLTLPPGGFPASEFTSTIDWGDPSPDLGAGTITQDASNPSLYYISGTHTFTNNKNYTVANTESFSGGTVFSSVNGTSVSFSFAPAGPTAGNPATVKSAQGTLAVSAFPIVGTEGAQIPAAPIATFIDAGGAAALKNYSAQISIYNSANVLVTSFAATSITQNGNAAEFTVNAPAFTLPDEGTYQVVVAVTDSGGKTNITVDGTSTAFIADAPLTPGPTVALTTGFGDELKDVVVGYFSDANTAAPATDFTAVIDWGDSSGLSLGMIVPDPNGPAGEFEVLGTHTYNVQPGIYDIQVNVQDVGGSEVTLTGSTATVTVQVGPSVYLFGNNFHIEKNANGNKIVFIVDGVTYTEPTASVDNIYLFGRFGNDTLTVDSSNGLINAPINYYGSTLGFNSMFTTQTGGPVLQSETLGVGGASGTGMDSITDGTNTESISFFNLAPLFLSVPVSTFTIAPLPGASILNSANAINYVEGTSGVGDAPIAAWGVVTIDNFEPINFAAKDHLVIDAAAGSDEINLDNPFIPVGSTPSSSLQDITVKGADPTASDKLVVNGTTGADAIRYFPGFTPGDGEVDIDPVDSADLPTVFFTGIEDLAINGQGGADDLFVYPPNGTDQVTISPGSSIDSGHIAITNGVAPVEDTPVDFSNLGAQGAVFIVSQAPDPVIYDGTVADDTFNVGYNTLQGTNEITLVNSATGLAQIPVFTPGVSNLVLDGISGNDTFNVSPSPVPYSAITLEGGPTDANVANLTGDGTTMTATLGSLTPTVVGGGLGSVTLSGIQIANLNDSAAAGQGVTNQILIQGIAGQSNNFMVTPTGTTTATIHDNGLDPMLNTTNGALGTPGLLVIGGVAGNTDTVTVNGSAANDTITATSAVAPMLLTVSVQVDSLPVPAAWKLISLNPIGLAALVVNAGLGNDTLTVDSTAGAFPIPITYDGGGGNNSLTLRGGTANTDTYTPGPATGAGTSVITFPLTAPNNIQTVNFVNLAPVFDTVASANLIVNGNNASNAINYTGVSVGDLGHDGLVTIDNLESIQFANKTALVITAQAGDDEINLNNPFTPAGLTSITVNGGDPTASDTLVVNGIASTTDALTVVPTGVGAGSVTDTAPAFVPVTFTGIENLTIVGQAADGDSLTVGGTAGNDTVQYTPGATADAGTITGFSGGSPSSFAYTPITFSGISGYVAPISPAGTQGGNDQLIVNGTAANDTFTFTGGGLAPFPGSSSIVVDGHTPIFFSPTALATNGVVLQGLAGVNTFNFLASTVENAGSLAVPIQVHGDGSDIINFTANAAASTTVNYGTSNLSSTSANSVTFGGLATINVTASGGTLLVDGTGTDDQFIYSPQSGTTNAGSVSLGVREPAIAFSGLASTAGAFTIDPLGGSSSVTIDGSSSSDLIVATAGASPTVQVNGTQTLNLVAADTQALVVASGLGTDNLKVDSTAGAFPIPITYIGGGGSDSLTLSGGTATSDTYTPGPATGAGTSVITFPLAAPFSIQTVNFVNLAPVLDTVVSANLIVNGNNASNAINYTGVSVGDLGHDGLVSVDNLETIQFTNKTALIINAEAGSDEVNLNNPFIPTGLTSITVNGGDPTASDILVVNGTAGQDAINYTPDAATTGSGAVTIAPAIGPALPAISFTGIENLAINGQGGNDSLTVSTVNGSNSVTLTPGAAVDSGGITITRTAGAPSSATPLSFSNLGSTGSLTIANSMGSTLDTLVYNGTTGSDTFAVAPTTGQITLTTATGLGQIAVNTPGVSALVLNGISGNDTFDVTGPQPVRYTSITLAGGPSGASVANLTGDGTTAATATLGGPSTAVSGGNLGALTLTGVGIVNLTNGAGNIDISGISGQPNDLAVTPTGPNTATIEDNNLAPVVNTTNTGLLFVGGDGGNSDTVTVNGGNGNNTIVATSAPSPTVQVDASKVVTLNTVGLTALAVSGGLGNDSLTINSTAGAFPLPITFNGGGGSDSLVLTGGTASTDAYSPGPGTGAGTSVITFAGPATQTVNFLNLSAVYDSVDPNTLTVTAGNASNAVNYGEGYAPGSPPVLTSGWGQVTVDNLVPINFTNKGSLIINALAGSDEINLNNSSIPTGLTSITVNGGDPTASDTLVVNGTAGEDAIGYAPDAATTGSGGVTVVPVIGPALPAVSFTGIENLAINGQGGNDNLTVATINGSDSVTLTPGAAVDSGGITITRTAGAPSSATPLSFSNLGSTGSLTIANNLGSTLDTLVYNGTTGNDTFTVAPTTGQITLVTATGLAQIPVNTPGVSSLVLYGVSSNNTFNVTGPQPYTAISLEGGATKQSVANLTGSGGSTVTATLGGTTIGVTGGALGAVTLSGVAVINLNSAGSNLNVIGTAGLTDNIAVMPNSASTAQVEDNGVAPIVNVTPAGGTFTVGGNPGDSDTVTVNGTAGNDQITLQGLGAAINPIVTVNSLLTFSVTTAGTAALVVSSSTGTDSVIVNSAIYPVTIPVTYLGGTGSDSLVLEGGNASTDTYNPGPSAGAGISTLVFPGNVTESVSFQNLSPVQDLVTAATLTVNGTAANNTINYTNAGSAYGFVTVDNFESITFQNKNGLVIDGNGGDDTIVLNNSFTPVGLATITVDGGTGDNTLVVNANDQLVSSSQITPTAVNGIVGTPNGTATSVAYTNIFLVHVINSMDALTGIPGPTISTPAGTQLNNVIVASFRFTDQPPAELGSPSDFLATIDWGDGTVANPDLTAGTIVELAPYNNVVTFQVLGTHTYASQGSFAASVTIFDKGSSRSFTAPLGNQAVTITANPGALTVVTPVTSTVTVNSAPITATGTPTNQVEGIQATTLVATIVDPNPGASPANYLVNGAISINWGDGTPVTDTSPPITVIQVGTQPNGVVFEVFAPHTYADAGNYTVIVTITRYATINNVPTPGSSTVAVSNEIVADAPLSPGMTQPTVSTDEATTFPTPEFGTGPFDNPFQVFSGEVAEFTDANPAAPINDFRATIDWGDGTPQSAGTIIQPGILPGTPFYVTGSHTYATSGVNGGVGHAPITVYITDVGGSKLTVFNTANIQDNPVTLFGILNQASDSGKSNGDDITNVSQPNFYGTVIATLPNGTQVTEPYAHVTLYANGVYAGAVQAGSDGSWSVNSNFLAQGNYKITATASDQFDQTISPMFTIVQNLVVDTAPPVITALSFNRFDATLTVTFQDNLSGMDLASITNSAFYHISATPLSSKVHVPNLILPTSILYTPGALPTDPVVVRVIFNHGHVFRGGKYEVVIDSGTGNSGIQDVAGNALSGNFYGTFPTGDGLPGGDFVAAIYTFHNKILPFVPIAVGYVPPAKGIDPPAGSSAGKAHKFVKTKPLVVASPKTQKMEARAAKLEAYDAALRELVAESKAKHSVKKK
jgi:hypothetical protein